MSGQVTRRGLLVLVLVLVLVALPAWPASAQPAAVVEPTGDPQTFVIRAGGFRSRERVSTWLTGPSQQVIATNSYRAASDGELEFEQRLPRYYQPGRWAITIHGLESGNEAIAYFQFYHPGPNATLAVSPASGPPGTVFTFSSGGFDADEGVAYWLTRPDGQALEGGYARPDAGGAVTFSYVVLPGMPAGLWHMSLYGDTSDRLGIATFLVT